MRVNESEFDEKIATALAMELEPSPGFDAAVFAAAFEILETRRARSSDQDARVRKSALARSRAFDFVLRLQWVPLRILAFHPSAPIAAFLVLVSALFFIQPDWHTRSGGRPVRFSDLPEFPKFNDAPARYDAQRRMEQQAYEREVEDAHEKTRGGI